MNLPKRIWCSIAALIFVWLPLSAAALPAVNKNASEQQAALSDADKAQLKLFIDRVKQYQKMERALPADKLSPTKDVKQLEQQRQALRDALQQARPNAKQGDLFTPEVAAVFRKLLRATMTGAEGRKIRLSLNHAEPVSPQDLQVNHVYPNADGQPLQSVPPSLLRNLPVLPKGLDYRISGHTLSLRDTDANMVVDYVRDAIP